MSSPIQHDEDHNDPLYYAPRRTRDAGDEASGEAARRMPRAANLDWRPRHDPAGFEGDAVLKQLRLRGSLDPELVSPPRTAASLTSRLGLFGRITLAVTVAAIAALLYVVLMPGQSNRGAATRGPNLAAVHSETEAGVAGTPRLSLKDVHAGSGESIALGIGVTSPTPGIMVLVNGLAAGTRITSGAPLGSGGWRLSARDLGDAALIPPRAYVGVMDLAVELRKADGSVADSGAMHLEWGTPAEPPVAARQAPVQVASSQPQVDLSMPQPVQQAMQPLQVAPPAPPPPAAVQPPAPPEAPATPPAQQATAPAPQTTGTAAAPPASQSTPPAAAATVDPEQVAFFLKRGEDFLTTGDITGARPLLERAAEGGNARAAYMLGATYDPIIIAQYGARGVAPDLARARSWYEKAKTLGSTEASSRLDQLANR